MPNRLRDVVTTGLEVAGAAAIVAGVNALVNSGAALVVAGIFGIVGGYLMGGNE
jgi:hypothetical protein